MAVYDHSDWYGLSASTLQMASAGLVIANDGVLPGVSIIQTLKSTDGNSQHLSKSRGEVQIIDPDAARVTRNYWLALFLRLEQASAQLSATQVPSLWKNRHRDKIRKKGIREIYTNLRFLLCSRKKRKWCFI